MKGDQQSFSWVDPDMILGNKPSIFRDVNPEIADHDTHFNRHQARVEGENPIIDIGATPMQVINSQIEGILDNAAKKGIVGKQNAQDATLIEINHLSFPKGIVRQCEVCLKHADFCCRICLVTFYCSVSHRSKDGVHSLICDRLRIIRNPMVHKSNSVERRRIRGQKSYVMEKLVDDLVRQSYGFLYQGKYEEAIITLNHSKKFLRDVFGHSHYFRQLVIVYAALCEAKLGMEDYEQAELLLRRAVATFYGAEDTYGRKSLNYTIALVNNTQGKLLYATGRARQSVFFFSEYIYHMTKELGPYHVRTCTGYFNLARSFIRLGMHSVGYPIIAFCVDIWVHFLHNILHSMTSKASVTDLSAPLVSHEGPEKTMSFYTEMEMKKNLHDARAFMDSKSHPKMTCEINLCQGIMLFMHRMYKESKEHAVKALRVAISLEDKDLLHKIKYLHKHAARRESWKK